MSNYNPPAPTVPSGPSGPAEYFYGAGGQILNAGFTLIELLVVLSIMVIITGAVILDFAGRREARNLNIAQNELVTNIRKVQAYALFSRNVGEVKPAQYYILKIVSGDPQTTYQLQAITDVASAPVLRDLETVLLPTKTFIQSVTVNRPFPPYSPATENAACALLAFRSPYAKIYVNNGCSQTAPPFQSGDSYQNVLNHISNINSQSASVDTDLLIQIASKGGSATRKVLVRGVTGLVCPSQDGTTCGF